jgi:phosphate transport system substrate-binding protein
MRFAPHIASAALAFAAVSQAAHGQAIVKVDGSSTVYPVTEAVAEEKSSIQAPDCRATGNLK